MTSDGRVLGRGRATCLDVRTVAGVLEHDPSGWFHETTSAARMALAEAGLRTVDAIGIGALGPAPLLLDDALQPLGPAHLFPHDATAPFLAWAARDPGIVDRAQWLVDVCGFLVSGLVGRPVIDRITAGDHVVPGGWPALRQPEAMDPFAMAGELTHEAATTLGLVAGTPVIAGTYDSFIDLAAIGVMEPGDRGILLGSTLIVGAVRETDDAPAGSRASRHAGEGWFVGGWTQAAGRALAWWLGLFPADRHGAIAREAAALSPGAGGLLALPYLDGERAPVWDPGARGAFVGLTTSTTAAELYRATIDAVALSAADLADRLHISEAEVRPWLVAGGGVRDGTWLRATADAIGEPMLAVDLDEAGGAARAALRALEVALPELPTRRVEPDAERHARFAGLLEAYRELYGALAPTVHALAMEHAR